MKQFLIVLFLGISFSFNTKAQQLSIKKGIIVDSLQVNDSIPESFALYLPQKFDTNSPWPVLFVFDLKGRGRQALRMFQEVAEKQGYVLAAPNNVNDSLSISENVIKANRVFNRVFSLFPIHKNRVYTAGFSNSARFASIIPTFIKGISGVVAVGGGIPNTEILSNKSPFYFIGIVGNEDYNYTEMLLEEKIMSKIRFPNKLLVFDGGQQWPKPAHLNKALEWLRLHAIAKGRAPKDSMFIKNSFDQNLKEVNTLVNSGKLLAAEDLLSDVLDIYGVHLGIDSLKEKKRTLKKQKLYKSLKRSENNALFKESLIKDDFIYYLEEDILTHNFNNLGWWNYQMQELKKYENGPNQALQRMGKRLQSYVNALVEDNIDLTVSETVIDYEALNFLWMLKTITAPKDYSYYLKIISLSSENEDFGTALFYLEELLKQGYKNKEELYALEHTALFKITPEFNKTVAKYLEGARYDINEE
ncbi:alpha/beta hydrolase [Spongiimicrobium sp. 3-5]|uniref:alpha/beta hydrolase n=1 Tax=Spongiimicrobium sp. 3-5 TaxID=3332596 RepID=UPI003981424C